MPPRKAKKVDTDADGDVAVADAPVADSAPAEDAAAPRRSSRARKTRVMEDYVQDPEEVEEKPKRGRGKAKAKEEDEEEEEEKPKKKAPAKKAPAKKAPAKRKRAQDDDDEEEKEDDDEEEVEEKKKPTRGRKKAKTQNDDEDDDETAAPAKPAKGKAAPKAKAAPKGRGKKAAKEEDEPEEEEAEEEEEEEKKIVTAVRKGRVAVDVEVPNAGSFHVLEQSGVVYNATLNQTNVKNNNNKFYNIQVLEKDSQKGACYVWNRWGRVGHHGQNKLEGPMSADTAISSFESKFKSKTLNHWSNRDNFEPKSGHYVMIHIDYGADEDEEKEEKKGGDKKEKKELKPSELPARLQKLIELICDVNMMKTQMTEIGYDAKKMPLGKLTKETVLKGYTVLNQISEVLNKARPSREKLDELTSLFYTYIPHNFGFQSIRDQTITTKAQLKAKMEMVESLAEIQLATKLLEDAEAAESDVNPIDAHYHRLQCKMQPMEKGCKEWKMIEEYIANTHGSTHSGYGLEVEDVFILDREGEDGRYQQFSKAHPKATENRMLLWHGSRLTNYVGILSQGLRIAPPEAPVTGYMFGKGVYFADMVSKSANYCFTTPSNNTGLLLLCDVALGDMNEKLQADYHADQLPSGKYSTKGMGMRVPDPAGTKTLPDGLQVPMGKETNIQLPGATLQYNEYIVYNTSQVRMRYLIRTKFNHKYH